MSTPEMPRTIWWTPVRAEHWTPELKERVIAAGLEVLGEKPILPELRVTSVVVRGFDDAGRNQLVDALHGRMARGAPWSHTLNPGETAVFAGPHT